MSNVRQLAKDKRIAEVNAIVKDEFDSEEGHEAIIGYLWGGHDELVLPLYQKYQNRIFKEMVMGYALAKNIVKVNELIAGGHDEPTMLYACHGYIETGYLDDEEDALEVITRTQNELLRSRLADVFLNTHPDVSQVKFLATVDRLRNLIQQERLSSPVAVIASPAFFAGRGNLAAANGNETTTFPYIQNVCGLHKK
jgi:hypothetical protein